MTIPALALQALTALGIRRPEGFDGTFNTFNLLSPADRTRVTNYSVSFVRANPEMFTTEEANVASRFDPVAGPQDTSFDIEEFFSEVGDNAEELIIDPVVNVGRTTGAVLNILPLVAVGIGAFLLWKNFK